MFSTRFKKSVEVLIFYMYVLNGLPVDRTAFEQTCPTNKSAVRNTHNTGQPISWQDRQLNYTSDTSYVFSGKHTY